MTNTTAHTHNLLLKLNRHVTAPTRKLLLCLFTICTTLSVVLIFGHFFIDSWYTLHGGFFFLPLALISGFLLPQFGKEQLSAKIQKQLSADPNTVTTYVFFDDHFTFESTSTYRHSSERFEYVLIDKVVKIDDTTMYIQSKTGTYYPIHEPDGVSEILRFLNMKAKATL
ncbi:MAG: hypothetical protein J6R46_05770 [Clostridia bacterium]|nr:hypothetical protein [Clostridia bacterium]